MLKFVKYVIINYLKFMISIILCMHNKLNNCLKCRINEGFELNQRFEQNFLPFVENYELKSPKMFPEIQI